MIIIKVGKEKTPCIFPFTPVKAAPYVLSTLLLRYFKNAKPKNTVLLIGLN